MVHAVFLNEIIDNGRVCGYRIADSLGVERNIKVESLRQKMINNSIYVNGLKLDIDNQIIRCETEQNVKASLSKLKLLGSVTRIPTKCGKDCYLITLYNNSYIIYIPEDVTELNGGEDDRLFSDSICGIEGTLHIVGGKGLESTEGMFEWCRAEKIEFDDFYTNNVVNMTAMFYNCDVEKLDLRSFNTKNVVSMSEMFNGCQATEIDLSSFDTKNVTCMFGMFVDSAVVSLDISSFDTSNVTDMFGIFAGCQAKTLNLGKFQLNEHMYDCGELFSGCRANVITTNSVINSRLYRD